MTSPGQWSAPFIIGIAINGINYQNCYQWQAAELMREESHLQEMLQGCCAPALGTGGVFCGCKCLPVSLREAGWLGETLRQ